MYLGLKRVKTKGNPKQNPSF